VGSTNLIVLDHLGDELTSYEIFVREGDTKRVTLRQGVSQVDYQCAPNCERTLSQTDSSEEHQTLVETIGSETGVNENAIDTQDGANPNPNQTKRNIVNL